MVGAVIVVYSPDLGRLSECYRQLHRNLDHVILVVNGNFVEGLDFASDDDVLYLGDNLGIASASNIGAKLLKERYNIKWVVFSDQDTLYPQVYFEKLRFVVHNSSESIFAPAYKDEISNGNASKYVLRRGNQVVVSDTFQDNLYQVIASGMVWRYSSFESLEMFREDLFIDWVDLELCWRAVRSGLAINDLEVVLSHRLGDNEISIFNKSIPLRSAMRYYYLLRNGVYLALYFNHGSFRINLWYSRKIFLEFAGYFLLSLNQFDKLYYLCLGVLHGLMGKLGKYDFN